MSVVKGEVVTVMWRGHELDREVGTVEQILPGANAAGMPTHAEVRFHRTAKPYPVPIEFLAPFAKAVGPLAIVPGAGVIVEVDIPEMGVRAGQLGRVTRIAAMRIDGRPPGPGAYVNTPGHKGERVEVALLLADMTCIGGPSPGDPGESGNREGEYFKPPVLTIVKP